MHLRRREPPVKMLLVFFTSLSLLSCTYGENPGVQLALTDKGLQAVRHFAAGVIQDHLDKVTIPEVRETIKWYRLQYTLSGMRMVKCDLPEPSVQLSPDTPGLVLSVSGLSVAVSGDWATKVLFLHDKGTFDVGVFDVSVRSVVKLDRDGSGRLSVSSVSCDADVQRVELLFRGGQSWMSKQLAQYLTENMKKKVQNNICPGVEETISRLEQHLQAMNVSVNVNSIMSLELPLSVAPVVDSDWINLGLRGEFLSSETQHEPPFVAPPFTLPKPSNAMLSVGVSEYSLNSASFAYFDSGHLQTLLNDSMIPPDCPVRLNTSSWGPYVPQLPQLFPDLPMTLQVYARQTPLFSFRPGVVELQLLSAVKVSVVQKNSTVTPVFSLNLDSAFSGKMWVDSGKIKSVMKMDNLTVTLDSTEIGPFKTEALENLIQTEVNAAVKKINVKLQQGFDLPQTRHVHLLNSVLSVEQGFISFTSDAKLQSTF